MAEMTVHYPDELLRVTKKSRQEIEREMRFQLAVRMYQLGEYSLGQAATSVGMEKLEFADELGKARIPLIDFDDSELAAELRAIREDHRR